MSINNFYIVRISGFDSFALIEAFGKIPEIIPREVSHLVPGNNDGSQDHLVTLKVDNKYLETQVMSPSSECSSWFGPHQKKIPWTWHGTFAYRVVGTFVFM